MLLLGLLLLLLVVVLVVSVIGRMGSIGERYSTGGGVQAAMATAADSDWPRW